MSRSARRALAALLAAVLVLGGGPAVLGALAPAARVSGEIGAPSSASRLLAGGSVVLRGDDRSLHGAARRVHGSLELVRGDSRLVRGTWTGPPALPPPWPPDAGAVVVLFAFDCDRVDATTARLAREFAAALPAGARVEVTGHTDELGSEGYNLALSTRRAASVADAMAPVVQVARPVGALGESEPRAQNRHPDGSDDPEGRQLNRRVEVHVRALGHATPGASPRSEGEWTHVSTC